MISGFRCGALLCAIAVASPSPAAPPRLRPPPRDIAARAFDCVRETPVTDLRVDLVIDDSESMAGFLRVSGGTYRDLLRLLTERLVMPGTTIRSLSRPFQSVERSSDLLQEDFYRSDTTPLQNAFDRVESNGQNVVTVVVSDMVQSGSDIRVAIEALTEALDRSPHVLIIGLTTPFYEDSQKCAPNCRQDIDRHFYLIALAHDALHLKAFMTATGIEGLADHRTAEEVRKGTGEGPTLFYSNAPILKASRIEIIAPKQSEWSAVVREKTTIDCDAGMNPAPFVAFATAAPRSRQLTPLFLRVNVRVDSTIADSVHIMPKIDQTNSPPATTRATATTKVSLTPNGWAPLDGEGQPRWIKLQFDAELPRTNQWRIFRVRSYIRAGPLHVPWWVEKWSREDHSTDGTLALESIVRTINDRNRSKGKSLLLEMWLGLIYEKPI